MTLATRETPRLTMPEPMVLDALEVCISSAERRLVGPVSFSVDAGECVGLEGPSGAGKSSLLRAMVGLLPPELRTGGRLRVLDRDPSRSRHVHALRSRAVLVGQAPVLFRGSIYDNTIFGLRHQVKASRAVLAERAERALREAALWPEVADRMDESATALSAGQRQRLCLARALALDPELLLLDEPTSALDHAARDQVSETINGLRGERTIVLVSHDPQQVATLCDSVVPIRAAPS